MPSPNADHTSLSALSAIPLEPERQPLNGHNDDLEHVLGPQSLAKESKKQLCHVKSLDIIVPTSDLIGTVSAFLHTPQNYHREQSEGREMTTAILLSGASGGVAGPSTVYLSLADKLVSLNRGMPVLRMDWRFPARNKYCVADVMTAMDCLENGYAAGRFVLVG